MLKLSLLLFEHIYLITPLTSPFHLSEDLRDVKSVQPGWLFGHPGVQGFLSFYEETTSLRSDGVVEFLDPQDYLSIDHGRIAQVIRQDLEDQEFQKIVARLQEEDHIYIAAGKTGRRVNPVVGEIHFDYTAVYDIEQFIEPERERSAALAPLPLYLGKWGFSYVPSESHDRRKFVGFSELGLIRVPKDVGLSVLLTNALLASQACQTSLVTDDLVCWDLLARRRARSEATAGSPHLSPTRQLGALSLDTALPTLDRVSYDDILIIRQELKDTAEGYWLTLARMSGRIREAIQAGEGDLEPLWEDAIVNIQTELRELERNLRGSSAPIRKLLEIGSGLTVINWAAQTAGNHGWLAAGSATAAYLAFHVLRLHGEQKAALAGADLAFLLKARDAAVP